MRKLLLILAVCLIGAVSAPAQEVQHIEFDGVPLGGSVEDVVIALKARKYKQVGHTATLKGKVMGQKADIVVGSSQDGKTVCLVLVTFETKKNWENVRTCYESMKMQLRLRYGDPALFKEEFDSPLAEADPIKALQYGNCTFLSSYRAPGGEIVLAINKDAQVQIYYVDTASAVSLQ